MIGAAPQLQGFAYNIERVNGRSYERTWIGPVGPGIDGIRIAEEPLAESVRYKEDGAIATLTCRYAYSPNGVTEVPQETQELDTDAIQQHIFLNETFSALTAEIQHAILKETESKQSNSTNSSGYRSALNNISKACSLAGLPGLTSIANTAFDLLMSGTESFETYSFTLNRTRTVSRRYSTKISLSDINKVFNTEQLVATVGNPLLFDVPTVALTSAEGGKRLMAGWRKKACRVVDVANGTRQMVEVWQLAKWSLNLYQAK